MLNIGKIGAGEPTNTDPRVTSWPPSIPDPQAWFDSLIDQAD